MTLISTNPEVIAELGEKIYEIRYKAAFEVEHYGKFAAIDINGGSATLGDSASSALLKASADHPDGFFHLIRVGHTATFEVGMTYRNADPTRIHR